VVFWRERIPRTFTVKSLTGNFYLRKSGILLHVTSLPGRYGMGEIGPSALRWLDTLKEMRQSLWQILPLGPTGFGNSPYAGSSSFAGNELLVSIEQLNRDGLLRPSDLNVLPRFDDGLVDFESSREVRTAVLKLACQNFRIQIGRSPSLDQAFSDFCHREHPWLDEYALFTALKNHFKGKPWYEWPEKYKFCHPECLAEAMAGLHEEIEDVKIQQFFFESQWNRVRKYAHKLGIQIIGDAPIFVAHDSADVWAHPELFLLDDRREPTAVAGVPPDFFSSTGQRWGNPLYDWEAHAASGYAWWIARMRRTFDQVDIVRIDHFRGFSGYWEIPAGEPTATNGKWSPGPGDAFFEAVTGALSSPLPIIAEDLGVITDDVTALRDRWELPGMRVLQFAFGSDALATEYLPENYTPDSIAYTGTHDNDTTLGHFADQEGEATTRTRAEIDAERRRICAYFNTDGTDIHWTFMDAIMHSGSDTAITPLQDLLGLDTGGRMNTPGTVGGKNWRWRFTWNQLTTPLKEKFATLTLESGRGLDAP